ncbi:MAG: GntR family transcriptional regulator [Lentisphaerae bacterium]|nr:GntR family transcriptional regulator [Lentisphaerota bacterium]
MSISQYNQVADRLRQDILAGRHASGVRLPTERDLCTGYDVSRITIRQALSLLEDEQLIIRRQGSGTYVRQNPTRRIPLMIDYTGSVREHAPTLSRELLATRTVKAPEWIADELRVSQNSELLYAERIDRLSATAVAWDEVYIRRDYANNLTADELARVDFIEAWCEAQQFCPLTCRQRVNAVTVTPIDAQRFGLPVGTPLLKAVDIYDVAQAKPVGLFVSHYHPEYITITSRFNYVRD